MDKRLLRNSLDVLYGLREELHGKADSSVNEQLDEVINCLDAALHDGIAQEISSSDVLKILGSVVELISSIVALSKLLK